MPNELSIVKAEVLITDPRLDHNEIKRYLVSK